MLENLTTTTKYSGTKRTEEARYEVTYEMSDTMLLSITAVIYINGIAIGTMGMNQSNDKMCTIKGDTVMHMQVLEDLIKEITGIDITNNTTQDEENQL